MTPLDAKSLAGVSWASSRVAAPASVESGSLDQLALSSVNSRRVAGGVEGTRLGRSVG